jgi:ABC-type multidrug transport system ATPase subunit
MDHTKAVSVQNLKKSYKDLVAIENITFEAQKGEIFGLIGPDGAGKTTIFRILTTLLLPDEGYARIGGYDVIKDYRKIRLITGYMPGRFSLYMDMSVRENLEFFATIFGTTVDENYHLIKDIYHQIEPFKDRLARNLSGGMKQKLALSCALIHKPEILVLDEPTTGVDAVSRKEFWEMLLKLKKQGITILVSTPYMDEAGRCDRVGLIQGGNIMTIDTPEQIINDFPSRLYAAKSANIYRLLQDLRTHERIESVYPFGEFLHITGKEQTLDRNELLQFIEKRGHQEIQVKEIEPVIEDCFMNLMNE